MCRLLESISLRDGVLENLEYHLERIKLSRAAFGYSGDFDFYPIRELAQLHSMGWYKVRFEYKEQIERLACSPYVIKPIRSLKIVHADHLDYAFKQADRSKINKLFSQRGQADDILICQNGLITDTSYCNVAFLNSEVWVTPKVPLLAGTKRKKLLAHGILFEEDIDLEKLTTFTKVAFINAFLDLNAVDLIVAIEDA